MRRQLVLVTAVLLLTGCSPVPRPTAAPQITPPAPAPGRQEDCKEAILADESSCVAWTAPEPHRFSEIARLVLSDAETGTGKGVMWGPYYACDVIRDDVARAALGSADVVRLVTGRFYCQVVVRGRKNKDVYDSLSVYISPYKPGNPAYDWFVEPNQLGEVTTVKGRKAVRNLMWSSTVGDRIQYTVEMSGHAAVWNIQLDRMAPSRGTYTPNAEDIDRRAQIVIDALAAYDQT